MHPPLARIAAVNVGTQARWLSRTLGRGGGTSLPGLLAQRIDAGLVGALAGELGHGCVLVTGTNGKTTTTRMLADVARRFGWTVLSNREGSNLLRGVATVLLDHSSRAGHLDVPEESIGIFEVDEGALPGAIDTLRPRLVVITNLFRDQLDRYFEVDFVARLWATALRRLPADATLVINADDAQVAYLGEEVSGGVAYYGLEDVRHAHGGLEHAADSRRCPRCGTDLHYERSFYAHLGHYGCGQCGWRRPAPRVAGWRVELSALEGTELEASTAVGNRVFQVPLPGLFNAYNALGAIAGASALGINPAVIEEAVAGASGAFGRLERFRVGDTLVCLLLVKNPSGFNQALRLVLDESQAEPVHLLLALNDNGPDGRDVSWIWDVDLELCAQDGVEFIMAAGERAHDLALRLKYAGMAVGDPGSGSPTDRTVVVEEDVVRAFWRAVERTPPGATLYVLPSYTAMWRLRENLAARRYVPRFYEQVELALAAA
ncbi:MAG: DUF1727 domain-containing protein [Solirubrobacterales bacterium]|nr:DUF1727 domain-containing protein [Solirubrobacterales bacterium]